MNFEKFGIIKKNEEGHYKKNRIENLERSQLAR